MASDSIATIARLALAEQLQTTPRIREAFAQIPRHHFVPSYYARQEPMLHWQRLTMPAPDADERLHQDWLHGVYADKALVTALDGDHMPISSSSQPSTMAQMLEALDLQPGMRVLEIGTGTGYNAALLAMLVGDPSRVVTIELDPEYAALASVRLDAVVGPGITVLTGDGQTERAKGAPFDRIISTARATTLPDAWLDQLAPTGRLVTDLGGDLSSQLIQIQAEGEVLTGTFLPGAVRFMGLRSPIQALSLRDQFRMNAQRMATQPPTRTVSGKGIEPTLFQDRAWLFFLQWTLPQAALQWWGGNDGEQKRPVLLDHASQTILTLVPISTGWQVQEWGTPSLWATVRQAREEWEQLGRPDPGRSRLLITRHHQGSYHKRLVISSEQAYEPPFVRVLAEPSEADQ